MSESSFQKVLELEREFESHVESSRENYAKKLEELEESLRRDFEKHKQELVLEQEKRKEELLSEAVRKGELGFLKKKEEMQKIFENAPFEDTVDFIVSEVIKDA